MKDVTTETVITSLLFSVLLITIQPLTLAESAEFFPIKHI
jgi:hypothetical protein